MESAFESTSALLTQNVETTEATAIIRDTLPANLAASIESKHPKYKLSSTPTESHDTQNNFFNGPIELKSRSKVEPIYAIDEEQRQTKNKDTAVPLERETKTWANSKIYKLKVRRSHQSHNYSPLRIQSRRCRSNQYRDISGNCRTKRSPSGSLL